MKNLAHGWRALCGLALCGALLLAQEDTYSQPVMWDAYDHADTKRPSRRPSIKWGPLVQKVTAQALERRLEAMGWKVDVLEIAEENMVACLARKEAGDLIAFIHEAPTMSEQQEFEQNLNTADNPLFFVIDGRKIFGIVTMGPQNESDLDLQELALILLGAQNPP